MSKKSKNAKDGGEGGWGLLIQGAGNVLHTIINIHIVLCLYGYGSIHIYNIYARTYTHIDIYKWS